MEFGSLQQKQQCPAMGKVNDFGERLTQLLKKCNNKGS
jgi:hypothetical protein